MDKRPHAERDADAGFERLLRETLRDDVGAAGSECIDPDMLAAWSEGALSPSERSFVDAHAARCGRCQAMLAAIGRTVPVDADRAAWSVRQWMMIFAPAAAAATAVALWFAVEPRRSQVETPSQQVAAGELPAAPVAAAPAREEERASADRPAAAPAGPAGRTGTDPSAAPLRDRVAASAPDPRSAEPKAAAAERTREESDRQAPEANRQLLRDARQPAAAAPPPPPPPPRAPGPPLPAGTGPPPAIAANSARSKAAANAESNANAAPVSAGSVNAKPAAEPPVAQQPPAAATTVTAQSPMVQTSQAARADQQQAASLNYAAGRGGQAQERGTVNESVGRPPLLIPPADRAVQFRVVNDRIVQQSADTGATWVTQYTLADQAAITAGSSPTPRVAWLVGRAGLVLATIDGRTWRRIAFPEPVDLVGVRAIDARTATVTTSDRRTFTTADGGVSWAAGKD